LESLADKSLLEVANGRYRMLDTIREFSTEQLVEAGEEEQFRKAHAEYFLELAETAEPNLRRTEQLAWLAKLTAEHANLHAALRWAVHANRHLALKLVGALSSYWRLRGVRSEVAPLARQLLDDLEPPEGLEEEYVLAVLNTLPSPHEHSLDRAREIMRTSSWPLRHPDVVISW